MESKPALTLYQPAMYRLSLQGNVSVSWSDWLKEVEVRFEHEGQAVITIVTGKVRDQAALFGLLSFVRDLGVPLISVQFIPPQAGDHKE